MKNTKANRQKFLQGYLKILLSWKNKKQDVVLMKNALEELNQSLSKRRKVKLYMGISDLWSDLGNDLWNDLWNDLGNDLGSNLRSETWEYYEFIWPVFVGYFYKNLPTIKRRIKTIEALDKCIKSGIGYLWLSNTMLYAIPFPKITIDEKKRLHCEDGCAIEWNPKEKSWWFHGVKVTQKIVETPEKLTKNDWIKETNLEVRRIIQERMGERFVKELKGKKIHKGAYGELLEIDLPNDPDKVARYAHVKDTSTKREYYLRVPPTIADADEAIGWSFEETKETYKPVQQS